MAEYIRNEYVVTNDIAMESGWKKKKKNTNPKAE